MIQLTDKSTKEPYEINAELLASKFLKSTYCDDYVEFRYSELLAAVIDFITSKYGLNSIIGYDQLQSDSRDYVKFESIVRPVIAERKERS